MKLNRKTSVLGTKWWNNGIKNKRAIVKPEGEWKEGRIKPSFLTIPAIFS